MDQDRKRDKSERERPAEGDHNRTNAEPSRRRNSGGISNRPLDRERNEQEQLPERGEGQSER